MKNYTNHTIKAFLTLITVLLGISCSQIETEKSASAPNGYGYVILSPELSAARTVSPFKREYIYGCITFSSTDGKNQKQELNLEETLNSPLLLQTGSWKALVEGGFYNTNSISNEYPSYTFSLETEEFTVKQNTTLNIYFSVTPQLSNPEYNPESAAATTGNFNYTLTLDKNSQSLLINANSTTVNFTVTLTPQEGTVSGYTFQTGTDTNPVIFDIDSHTLTLKAAKLTQGFYLLSINFVYASNTYKLLLPDSLVYIEKGLVTEESAASVSYIKYENRYEFYGTNADTGYNGINAEYPKNLDKLLTQLNSVNNFLINYYLSEDDTEPHFDLNNIQDGAYGSIMVYENYDDTNPKYWIDIEYNSQSLLKTLAVSFLDDTAEAYNIAKVKNRDGWSIGKSSYNTDVTGTVETTTVTDDEGWYTVTAEP